MCIERFSTKVNSLCPVLASTLGNKALFVPGSWSPLLVYFVADSTLSFVIYMGYSVPFLEDHIQFISNQSINLMAANQTAALWTPLLTLSALLHQECIVVVKGQSMTICQPQWLVDKITFNCLAANVNFPPWSYLQIMKKKKNVINTITAWAKISLISENVCLSSGIMWE